MGGGGGRGRGGGLSLGDHLGGQGTRRNCCQVGPGRAGVGGGGGGRGRGGAYARKNTLGTTHPLAVLPAWPALTHGLERGEPCLLLTEIMVPGHC